jgi:hypothetical protein
MAQSVAALDRFCITIASASEQVTSAGGMPDFKTPSMSVPAETAHLAATGCSLSGFQARMPVPEAHLSFIEAITRRSPRREVHL